MTNLPLLLTSFIGRERESQEILRLLSSARLLTLTGPPGCGKTRLALETGHALCKQYADGAWLVDLTQTGDPAALSRLIAKALELVIQGEEVEQSILDYLRSRELLLILDNCEHVVEEAARLCLSILSACPNVRVIATSQVPLGVPGEQEWLVPSLPVPDEAGPMDPAGALYHYDAVRLFVERAAAAQPGFRLGSENAAAVAAICRSLDGIPLAIELAAARVKVMSVADIHARLDSRFALLAAPRRLVASRHQTLQNALDWSFQLLDPAEGLLLTRLSAFQGTFSLAAVEAVCGFYPLAPSQGLSLLGELVDRSLVTVSQNAGQQTRYRLLESIRLYGWQQLGEGDRAVLNDRHLDYFMKLIGSFERGSVGLKELSWLDQIDLDMPNLRAAIHWVIANPEPERVLKGLKLTAGFAWYYRLRDYSHEPVDWLEKLLSLAVINDNPAWVAARANAYFWLGWLYFSQDQSRVEENIETSRALWKTLGDGGRRGYAFATVWRTNLAIKRRGAPAVDADLQECRQIFEAIGDPEGMGFVLLLEGDLAYARKNIDQAERWYRAMLDAAIQGGYHFLIEVARGRLCSPLQQKGQFDEAIQLMQENIALERRMKNNGGIALNMDGIVEALVAMGRLDEAEKVIVEAQAVIEKIPARLTRANLLSESGDIALLKGEYASACALYEQAAAYFHNAFATSFAACCLGIAAALAEQDPVRAARLLGHARHVAGTQEVEMYAANVTALAYERIALARAVLGDAEFTRVEVIGAALTFEELFRSAGEPAVRAQPLPALSRKQLEKARFAGLTSREREIAARIARGLSNPAIAVDLTISERTVTTHVTNILSKLGFSSRTQIAAWAAEKGLLHQ